VAHAFALRAVVVVGALIFAAPSVPAAEVQDAPVVLVPHRAIYELTLGQTRESAQIAGVRGRILYDFAGNACDGYTLQFRQVSELDSGEGKTSTSDLRSTTWEGGDAKRFKFTSQNFLNQNLIDSVDGHAEHGATATAVNLAKPEQKALDIDAAAVFPTEHMVRVIEAARAGKTVLNFPVYDGSDTGDKVYETLTVIGRKLGSDERKHDDAAAAEPQLAGVPRWPVTISYFEKSKGQESSEQTPVYAISFELYANGISRALSLDYNDFIVTGKLSSLEIKAAAPCK
jgi:EipB-like